MCARVTKLRRRMSYVRECQGVACERVVREKIARENNFAQCERVVCQKAALNHVHVKEKACGRDASACARKSCM